jgi:hypothetical protein
MFGSSPVWHSHNKEKLIPPWVDKRLLRDFVFAIRASGRFGQDELERAVLPDDFGQKPIEWNLGIAGMTVLTRFGQFLGPVDHLGPDGNELDARPRE